MAEPQRRTGPRLDDTGPRLDNAAVRERLTRLDELIGRVEQIPGPSGEIALDAVSALAEVYGEALARAVGYVSGQPALLDAMTGDELLGHLLVLHDIHPDPVERRVARALDALRPAVAHRGADIELVGIDQDVARVRLSVSGCGSSAAELTAAVREAVLAVAPELSGVAAVPAAGRPDAAFIPLDALMSQTAMSRTAMSRTAMPDGDVPDGRHRGRAVTETELASAPSRASGAAPEAVGAAPAGALHRAIRRRPLGGGAQPTERCDLCDATVPERHRHVLDEQRDELLCSCQACTLLFQRDAAGRGHYRLVPDQRVRLPEHSPGELGVPVGLAFFVTSADGSVVAHYPSPMGATRWEVDAAVWREAQERCPALRDLAPRVQALLVNTARGSREHWIVPVDDCHRLVALVRREWQGLSGGSQVWPAIEGFFADLGRRPGSPLREAHR